MRHCMVEFEMSEILSKDLLLMREMKLLQAVRRGNSTEVHSLMEKGVDVNHWQHGYTPLTLACKLGDIDTVTVILRFQDGGRPAVKLDAYDACGNTAVLTAVRAGFHDIVTLLLSYGAGLDVPSQHLNQSPIAVALERGHHKIADDLLAGGCDVHLCDNIGISPLYLAIKQRHLGLVRSVLANGAHVNLGSQDHSPVFLAARLGLLDIVKVLIDAGCDQNAVNKFGVSPLYEAAAKGHVDMVRHLIGRGADIDRADMYNVTPLIVAAMFGHEPVVKVLVDGKANVRMRDDQQRDALQIAMEMGHCRVVTYFLENGLLDVIPHPGDARRLQGISRVFEQGDTNTVAVLLRACTRLPLPHYPGMTDMFRTNAKMMKLLLYSGNHVLPASLLADLDLLTDPELRHFLYNYRTTPLSLAATCRVRVRRCMANRILYSVKRLPLPQSLKDYVSLKDSQS